LSCTRRRAIAVPSRRFILFKALAGISKRVLYGLTQLTCKNASVLQSTENLSSRPPRICVTAQECLRAPPSAMHRSRYSFSAASRLPVPPRMSVTTSRGARGAITNCSLRTFLDFFHLYAMFERNPMCAPRLSIGRSISTWHRAR